MNYKEIYDALCVRGFGREFVSGLHHRHHVIPRCMGGKYKNNLTILTYREHYIVHKLLIEIYPANESLRRAFSVMLFGTAKTKGLRYTSREFSLAMKISVEANTGKKHSKETIQKLRDRSRGRSAWNKGLKLGSLSKERKKKQSLALSGVKKSIDHNKKVGVAHRELIFEKNGHLLQFDLNGIEVARYRNIQDINKDIFDVTNLREAVENIRLKNRSGYYKSYFWIYEKYDRIDFLTRKIESNLSHTNWMRT